MNRAVVVTTWLVATVACTGGSSSEPVPGGSTSGVIGSSSSGSSGTTKKAIPRVAASATLSGDSCAKKGTLPDLGSLSVPVDDGGVWAGKTASVTCSVLAAGEQFSVQALATLGDHEVEYSVNGSVPAANPQTISNAQVVGNGDTYRAESCKLEYVSGGVAPGRFWGTITCENVTPGCTLRADVRFENCSQ